MRAAIHFLAVATLLLLPGCKGDPKESATVETGPIALSLGINTNEAPFFEFDGILKYSQMASGKTTWSDGSSLTGKFTRLGDGATVNIEARVKIEAGRYEVTGTFNASVPFTLTFLGTAEEESDEARASFEAGEGTIEFTGESPYTFERNNR